VIKQVNTYLRASQIHVPESPPESVDSPTLLFSDLTANQQLDVIPACCWLAPRYRELAVEDTAVEYTDPAARLVGVR
jgi:hypothetical protein